MSARPSTVRSMSQSTPCGTSSTSADETVHAACNAETKDRALRFLVSAAGTSGASAKFNLEAFDATGPDQGYIVPKHEDLGSLTALPPKLRLEPDRIRRVRVQ